MIFEQYVLPVICVVGVLGILWYGKRDRRREAALGARKMALGEAAAALQSLADCAMHASRAHAAIRDRDNATIAAGRHYYYDRAAQIVRSIPVDRL